MISSARQPRTSFALCALALAIAALAFTGIAGCGGSKGPKNVVVVLVDTSRSANGAVVKSSYRRDFGVLTDFFKGGAGGVLVADAISSNSLGKSSPVSVTFDHKSATTNPLTFAAKIAPEVTSAKADFSGLVDSPPTANGTTIVDALANARDYFTAYPNAHHYLVILSDMVEESSRLRFNQQVLTSAGTTAWLSSHHALVPDLSDVAVYVAGAGLTTSRTLSPATITAIHTFWSRFLQTARADLVSYRATLFAFP